MCAVRALGPWLRNEPQAPRATHPIHNITPQAIKSTPAQTPSCCCSDMSCFLGGYWLHKASVRFRYALHLHRNSIGLKAVGLSLPTPTPTPTRIECRDNYIRSRHLFFLFCTAATTSGRSIQRKLSYVCSIDRHAARFSLSSLNVDAHFVYDFIRGEPFSFCLTSCTAQRPGGKPHKTSTQTRPHSHCLGRHDRLAPPTSKLYVQLGGHCSPLATTLSTTTTTAGTTATTARDQRYVVDVGKRHDEREHAGDALPSPVSMFRPRRRYRH